MVGVLLAGGVTPPPASPSSLPAWSPLVEARGPGTAGQPCGQSHRAKPPTRGGPGGACPSPGLPGAGGDLAVRGRWLTCRPPLPCSTLMPSATSRASWRATCPTATRQLSRRRGGGSASWWRSSAPWPRTPPPTTPRWVLAPREAAPSLPRGPRGVSSLELQGRTAMCLERHAVPLPQGRALVARLPGQGCRCLKSPGRNSQGLL